MESIILTTENFDQEVLEVKDQKVLVDFWGVHCGPCKIMDPIIDEIAAEREDIKVCKCNVDENRELAKRFSVLSKPTFLVFKDGKEVGYGVGTKPKEALLEMVDK